MSIVCKSYSQAYSIAKHNCQRNDTFPRQIGSILYTAGNRAGARTADTDRTDGLIASVLLDLHHDALTEHCHKLVNVRIVFRREGILRQDIPSDIHDCIGSTFIADVDTNNPCLDIKLFHSFSKVL